MPPTPCPDRRALRRDVVAYCLVARRFACHSLPRRRCGYAKSRDKTRQQILQSELATEKKAYDDANGALSAAISGKQLSDKIDALKQSVLDHQKNVEAIQGELANLDRAPSGAKAALVAVRARAAATPMTDQRPAPYWDVYNRPQPQPADAQ
ncbi:hypothetical protein ACFOHQ_21580 [Xanthomonas fragariae]